MNEKIHKILMEIAALEKDFDAKAINAASNGNEKMFYKYSGGSNACYAIRNTITGIIENGGTE